jgi:hypothetical protein
MISRDDYTVRLVDDLPASVGGFVTESPDGHLNIYINARHGWKGQRRSFRHELRHADADDLRSTTPLAIIEARADQKPSPSPSPLPSPLGKVARPVAGSDEVAARLASIPHLILARDLLPSPPPTVPQLTPRQYSIIMTAIADLDRLFFTDDCPY